MRLVIKMTTRKDGDKNQLITNINYDQNSPFFETFNYRIKMASDKIYGKEK